MKLAHVITIQYQDDEYDLRIREWNVLSIKLVFKYYDCYKYGQKLPWRMDGYDMK